jgi:hypothetical protein
MIAAPKKARIDASLCREALQGNARVVHVGQSVLVLELAPRAARAPMMLTITDRAGGVTPGGLSIPNPAEFARIHGDFTSVGSGAAVDLSGWTAAALEPVDLVLVPRTFSGTTVRAVSKVIADEMSAAAPAQPHFDGGLARVRSRATDLAIAALTLDPDPVLAEIIGAGPGTTPTGDDMVVGCLAALAVLGRGDAASRLAQATAPLLQATTTTSRHYLEAAASGRFGEHVHDLIAGFVGGYCPERMLAHARRWGATSGVDLLIGMTVTLRVELANQTEEGAA